MNGPRNRAVVRLMVGASAVALGLGAHPAFGQGQADPNEAAADEIIVKGIRASLRNAQDIKRESQGVVDAISAEDIGKFPDTNLAESLQRITGVSIDRASGEGSTVTVRGFGPEFNLVVVNGRQMPTSTLGDGFSAPSSRSFDFGNLAAEGVAGVEVYKSGRASLPTGGIGSVINIKLPRPLDRPGLKGSIGVKGVYDTSQLYGTDITPEISGIVSKTFADDTIGILLAGSFQKRNGGQAQFSAGNWRPGYTGAENNWGTLAQAGDPRFANIQNRPGPTDIYQVPQNAAYDFYDFKRERINGQAVLQFKPTDTLDIAVDYIFSQNTFESRQSSIGVWFNHGDTSSSWTSGPAAGANFYAENFGAGEGKDLAITGAVGSNRNVNHSIGGNIKWEGPGGLRLEFDGHHSTAESKPTSPYGSGIAVGAAIFGVKSQRLDNTTGMPVLSVTMHPGADISAANIRPAGNAFRNAYMKDTIDQISLRGGFDFDTSFIKSLDFGASYIDNEVRTAFGVIQNDTWGGTLSAADTPDSLFTARGLLQDLAGMNGSSGSAAIPTYFQIDTAGLISLLDTRLGICNAAPGNTCLAPYSTDRRIREKSITPWIQSFHSFELGDAVVNLRMGLRYEKTKVTSTALADVPTGTRWVAQNEINLISTPGSFTTLTGEYTNWLPAFDFDVSPMSNVKLRASYSHTITRPDYASMQGGITLGQPLRVGAGGSQASAGNPALHPYKSKNIDLSAEWYYDSASYVSIGFFNKDVSNFIANDTTQTPLFNLPDPSQGAAATAARAALGAGASFDQIRNWVQVNRPADYVPASGPSPAGIAGRAGDPNVVFTFTQPSNSNQKARLWGWEFAVQHSFWDTGFGAILNYTIVKSDTAFDNTLPWTTTQFAVPGASDSANAVVYYDKNGLQARVAYNWRAQFLSGKDQDPYYIKSYGQFDVSASYEFRKGLTAFVEGINITNADRKGVRRNDKAVFFAAPGYARYAAGLRFNF